MANKRVQVMFYNAPAPHQSTLIILYTTSKIIDYVNNTGGKQEAFHSSDKQRNLAAAGFLQEFGRTGHNDVGIID
jgi:hypothetical protein